MTDISIDKANRSDALRLSILLKTVYISTYGLEGVTTEFADFISSRFSVEAIEKCIEENPSRLLVASFKGNPVGVSELIFDSSCPIRKTRLPELSKLYVLDGFAGKGIGYLLINAVENVVAKTGAEELVLEVWKNNPKAIDFYKRQGYGILGEVDFPMETNTYVNLVMNKHLK